MEGKSYEFNIQPNKMTKIIKVIGVGGGGSNAVQHMFEMGIHDVDFYICNTDIQALQANTVPNKVQIGAKITSGLGAGADPNVGKEAALESKEELKAILQDGTRMVFITAGMGGGTGTGAAPVIAEIAKSMGILTVGIVTKPFVFEGSPKERRAEDGIAELRKYCDTVLVILNDKLKEVYNDLSVFAAFSQADDVLTKAAKSIAEIITLGGHMNVDFNDVNTVLRNSGAAVMGSAAETGENRARKAAEKAIFSPLLNDTNIENAKYILLSIVTDSTKNLGMMEMEEITSFVRDQAGDAAEMIMGMSEDPSLGDAIGVTIIATGFGTQRDGQKSAEAALPEGIEGFRVRGGKPAEAPKAEAPKPEPVEPVQPAAPAEPARPTRIVHTIGDELDIFESEPAPAQPTPEVRHPQDTSIPAYLRKGMRLDGER